MLLPVLRDAAEAKRGRHATEYRSPFDQTFNALVERTLRQWHVPGLSIAVVDNGKIVSKGYGCSVLPDQVATADTVYMTGSTTKAFTAAAAALLVHDDEKYPQVKWTSPVNEFIQEDFVLENGYATSHVTIEDTLVHRVGLPRHDIVHGQEGDDVADLVRRLRYLPLTAEPARKYQYCPIMYGVAAHVLQTITGRHLSEQLNESFWKPLGMRSTTFTLPNDTSQLATGYWWHEAGRRYIAEPYDDLASITGSGDMFSTVNDYALWIRALMEVHGGDAEFDRPSAFPSALVRDMFAPRIIQDNSSSESQPILYALGWEVITINGELVVGHGGGETGFGTQVYMLPGKRYGVVTMSNTQETGFNAGATLVAHLLASKLDIPTDALPDSFDLLAKRDKQSSVSNTIPEKPGMTTLPLPLPMADFAGSYSHPAYGITNISLSKRSHASAKVLESLFYPRTWPMKVKLSHMSSTMFAIKILRPHGLGDVTTGEGIIWEGEEDDDDQNVFRAVFEFGHDGRSVERVGLELEASLVDMARKLGEKEWRKGMIWFDRY